MTGGNGMPAIERRAYVVEYTPGPPAIGTLTRATVEAATPDEASAQVRAWHPDWCMIHRVRLDDDAR